ncbi:unnamed protein product [Rhizophagus irregularis]|nr:unnamed protein product [Rhizophagus irregularis]
MSFYTGSVNTSFSSLRSLSSKIFLVIMNEFQSYLLSKPLWDKGELSEKQSWEEVTLPYVLAKGIDIEEYERRTEEFNIHGCWEWSNREVLIYELPSMPHEVCIVLFLLERVTETVEKKPMHRFVQKRPAVTAPNGSDGILALLCLSRYRNEKFASFVTEFEFGTQDGTGAPLNILQGQLNTLSVSH